MNILIACECSGIVREAFLSAGHNAFSCDLKPCETGSKRHITGDVIGALGMGWDMLIAHPPCTYLSSSGLHWNKRIEGRAEKTAAALEATIARYALEPAGAAMLAVLYERRTYSQESLEL